MGRIAIIVHGGMVQEVYSSDEDTEVIVIDEDVPEEDRGEAEIPAFRVY